jgi:DNA-binding NarL/FixJ family response regulator
MKILIAIVDDKTPNRVSLAERISYCEEIELVFTARNGIDFLDQLKALPYHLHPQVVLMDIEMPEMNGIDAVRQASHLYTHIKFLMLTVFDDDDKIFEAIKAGAGGYLLKDEKVNTIIEHLQQMMEMGAVPMSPSIARKAMNLLMKSTLPAVSSKAESGDFNFGLSERELEVLKLIVEGFDYKSIAQKIFLSTHTVRKHIANVYAKLHVSSKAQAIMIANTNKLIK